MMYNKFFINANSLEISYNCQEYLRKNDYELLKRNIQAWQT
jgi:hypothetical protein